MFNSLQHRMENNYTIVSNNKINTLFGLMLERKLDLFMHIS